MKTEVLTPEHEKVMAEHPGLNQRQWWLVSDLTERFSDASSALTASEARAQKLESELQGMADAARSYLHACEHDHKLDIAKCTVRLKIRLENYDKRALGDVTATKGEKP